MSSLSSHKSKTEEAIRSLSFFEPLDDTQIAQLSKISHIEYHEADYLLHYENSTSSRILFLVSGLAKAYKIDKYDNEVFLYHIHSDSLLSEISSLEESTLISYANVNILESSTILSIEYDKFQKAYISTGLMLGNLAVEILRQSKLLQGIINREFILDSVSKVAMMLDSDLSMFNRLKRSDIALMLHLQPATLSRVLNRLKRDDLISINKGEIVINDFDRLRNIFKDLL